MRMGLRYVRGLREEAALALVSERNCKRFSSVDDLARRVPELSRNELNMLAQIGALNCLGGSLGPNVTAERTTEGGFELASSCQGIDFQSCHKSADSSPSALPKACTEQSEAKKEKQSFFLSLRPAVAAPACGSKEGEISRPFSAGLKVDALTQVRLSEWQVPTKT